MNVALWIIAGLLAVAFLVSGAMKLTRSREELAASGMGYVNDFSDRTIKIIGTLEVLAAFGLVLPAVLGVAPVLVPLASLGLVLLMVGAVITHTRRKESQPIIVNLVLSVLAVVVVVGRFGPYNFAS